MPRSRWCGRGARTLCWGAMALAAAAVGAAQGVPRFVVIVPAGDPEGSVSAAELAALYRGRSDRWWWGGEATPVERPAGSALRAAFAAEVVGPIEEAVEDRWTAPKSRQLGGPPVVLASDEEVVAFVAAYPGAVGYVAATTSLPPGVRPLAVEGCERCDGSGGATRTERPPGDATLARIGALRLFLTGRCGPQGEGRFAVLQNRNGAEPVTAQVEEAVWVQGRESTSQVRAIELAAGGEERLGCTRLSATVEQRFLLREVSDAALRRRDAGEPPPARDAVRIVYAGSCGRGAAGRRALLVNHSPLRAVTATVEIRQELGGRPHRVFQKTHRLAPGAQEVLGCTEDGSARESFTLLEVAYTGAG